jgi:cyclic pyranopterin phosphate synthase
MSVPNELSHLDEAGKARMVDVGQKEDTERMAMAKGEVIMQTHTLELIRDGMIKKGDVLTVAQIAGIMAAKRTFELIPMCHPIPLHDIVLDLNLNPELPGIKITSIVKAIAKTGVEMEALTAVTVAALTVYDMAKAVEKTMKIQNIRLVQKTGGKSGDVFNE